MQLRIPDDLFELRTGSNTASQNSKGARRSFRKPTEAQTGGHRRQFPRTIASCKFIVRRRCRQDAAQYASSQSLHGSVAYADTHCTLATASALCPPQSIKFGRFQSSTSSGVGSADRKGDSVSREYRIDATVVIPVASAGV
jgi:hypothetical protein